MGWYTAQEGDTIESIASDAGLTAEELLNLETPLPGGGITNRTMLPSGGGTIRAGESVWLPGAETPEGSGADVVDERAADSDRRVSHGSRGGTSVPEQAQDESPVTRIRVVSTPWTPNDLSQWFRWQTGLSGLDVSRLTRSEDALWCGCAQGRRIALFWRQIREMTWGFGVDTIHSIEVGPFIWRCGLENEDLTASEAVEAFKGIQQPSLPGDLTDGAVRFHAWRRFMRFGVGAQAAQAQSTAWSTEGSPRAEELRQAALTVDPTEPYYAPVARIINLLSGSATSMGTWFNAPEAAQNEVIRVLAGVLLRNTRWELGEDETPSVGWFEALVRDVEGNDHYREIPRMNVREFYRVVYYSRPSWVLRRLGDDRPDCVRRMLDVLDHCRDRYGMTYLRTSSELTS